MTPFGSGGFRFEDRRQERIHDRLTRLVGPGAAAFYLDACRLMSTEPPLATTTHLVSHGIREIESSMRDVLETVAPRKTEKRNKPPEDNYRKEIITILAGLEIPEDEHVAQYWLSLPGRENSYGLHSRAHRAGLSSPRPLDEEFFQFWNSIQAVLDAVLDKFEVRSAEVLRAFESLIEKPSPSESDAERLALHLPENAILRSRFFAQAGPAWFEPLRRAGLFGRIPPPIHEGEEVRCLMWPAASYLARLARGPRPVQEAVLEVIREVASTKNFWAQEDFLDAALALPPDLSASLVPFIIGWLGSPFASGLPEKAGKLVRHLAEGGEKAAGLKLAHELLSPVGAPTTKKAAQEAAGPSSSGPAARFDLYHYDDILNHALPALARVAARETFEMVSSLLEQAIRFTSGPESDGRADLSWLWQPVIEDHRQNELPSLESSLVMAVRDVGIEIIKHDPGELPALILDLEGRRLAIFRRLALHLLRASSSAPMGLIDERLTHESHFEDVSLRPEYAFLLRERFGQLPPESQTRILNWIEKGPDLTRFSERYEKQSGKLPTNTEIQRYVKQWQLRKLLLIKDSVPADWRERCTQLEAEVGRPSIPPEFDQWTESWMGPTSPKSKAELSDLSVEDLLEFLRTWQPTDDPRSHSPEGLGRNLSELVAEYPERFDSAAPRFQRVDATYVRALLGGFRSAAGKGRSLDWAGVLDLCEWAVEQPRSDAVGDQDSELGLPDWRSVRQEIGYLLQAGLDRNKVEGIPFDLRERVWHILEPITNDPDPSPERDARSGADLAGLSLNSARPVAMRTVFSYAAWVRRNPQGFSGPKDVKLQGFDSMPEVRTVLDAHLDPIREPSLAIRSIYGEQFSQAVLLDPKWAENSVGRIFPQHSESRKFREAAWSSFLHFGRFTKPAFDLLRPDYARAIDELDSNDDRQEAMFSPGGRLAAHLMFLYWSGRLGFDDPESLLPRFFKRASDRLRGEAVRYLGRELRREELETSGNIQERLESFWSWRLEAARNADPSESHSEELASFGWWFSSKKLPGPWALGKVIEVLRMAGKIDPHHLVMERLADLAREMPGQALECLTLLLASDGRGFGLIGGRQEAKAVLSAAIDSGDDKTRKLAVELANRLISKGHLEFRDVIPSDPN